MKQINSTSRLSLICCATIFFSFLFSSCKKETPADPVEPIQETKLKYKVEEAYPGVSGQTFKLRFRNDEIYVQKRNDRYVWMGDIAFDQKTFDSLSAVAKADERTFKPTSTNQWSRGRVPILIDGSFTFFERNEIDNAITQWTNNSALTFVTRTTEPDFITIVRGGPGSGLFSDFIGRKGGQQIINLEAGAFNAGVVIHEIGHAIGFYHEQSRTDRDNAIVVHYNNVVPNDPGTIYQFQTYTERGEAGAQLGAFDFGSIMLYSSFDFSNGVNPTMTLLDGVTPFFAQRNNLSAGDIETAAFLYGPPFAKMVYSQTSYHEENGPVNEWVREEGFFSIEIYADQQCTVPALLTQAKTVGYYIYDPNSPTPILQTVTLQPGPGGSTDPNRSIYPVANYFYEYRSEYGNVVSFYQSGTAANGPDGFYRN